MIRRLPHPVLGVVAFVVVWVGGASLLGFRAGIPELVVLTAVGAGGFALVNRRRHHDL